MIDSLVERRKLGFSEKVLIALILLAVLMIILELSLMM